jgi:hypothetical protein
MEIVVMSRYKGWNVIVLRTAQIIFLVAAIIALIFDVREMIVNDSELGLSGPINIVLFSLVLLEVFVQKRKSKLAKDVHEPGGTGEGSP